MLPLCTSRNASITKATQTPKDANGHGNCHFPGRSENQLTYQNAIKIEFLMDLPL